MVILRDAKTQAYMGSQLGVLVGSGCCNKITQTEFGV